MRWSILKTPVPARPTEPSGNWLALAPLVLVATSLWFVLWRLDVQGRHDRLAQNFLIAAYALFVITCLLICQRAVGGMNETTHRLPHLPWLNRCNIQGATLMISSTAAVLGGFFLIDAEAQEHLGWVALCLAAVQIIVAALTRSGLLTVSSILQAAALMTIACALFFDEFALTLAWLALGVVMGALAFASGNRWARAWAAGPLMLATAHLCTVGISDTTLRAPVLVWRDLFVSRWLLMAWALTIAFHFLAWLNPPTGGFPPLRKFLQSTFGNKLWPGAEPAEILDATDDSGPAPADTSVLSYARPARGRSAVDDALGPVLAMFGSVLLVGATEFRIEADWVVTLLLLWSIPLLALIPVAHRLGYATHAAAILAYAAVRWLFADNLIPLVGNWPTAQKVLTPVANHPFLNGVALCILGVIAALQSRRQRPQTDRSVLPHFTSDAQSAAIVALAMLAFALLNFETLRFVDFLHANRGGTRDLSMARHMALSILWALLAFAAVAAGFRWKFTILRYAALALLGITVVKVLLVDMARVAAIWRILSFLAVGALLLGVSYIYQRNPEEQGRGEKIEDRG